MPTSTLKRPLALWRLGLLPCALFALAATAGAQAQEIKIGGTGSALGTMQLLAKAYSATQSSAKITVLPSTGSSGGIKALQAGAIQIAVSSRPLNEAESKSGLVAVEYGRTPFVFATSTSNRATGIKTQDLVDFYAGKSAAWADGSKLRLVLRPVGDSDSESIKSISPAMRDALTTAEQRQGMLFTVSDQDTAQSIETIAGALGPSTLALLLSEKRALKALALDGVIPSAQTLANGSYRLSKQMLIVTGPKTSPEAQAFVTFVLSAAGRDILQQTGHWVK